MGRALHLNKVGNSWHSSEALFSHHPPRDRIFLSPSRMSMSKFGPHPAGGMTRQPLRPSRSVTFFSIWHNPNSWRVSKASRARWRIDLSVFGFRSGGNSAPCHILTSSSGTNTR